MPITRKLDLALEARELHAGEIPGVTLQEENQGDYEILRVTVETEEGAKALGKPQGTYLTLTLPQLPQSREDLLQGAKVLSSLVATLPGLPPEGSVLVAGLGNRRVTPDAIGPRTADHLLVTRQILQGGDFASLRPVSALAPGVSGATGMESGEILHALAQSLSPSCLVAVDALAARRQERVCRTIQLSDQGIVPGSGVGNARLPLTAQTLGVPVLAVGVPTVVDAATLCLDLLEGAGEPVPDLSPLRREGEEWFVTPRNIDREVEVLSRLLAIGLSAALNPSLTVEEVEGWMV